MATSPPEELGFPVEEIVEGRARLLVPRMKEYLRSDGVYEPAWAPVFYNPRMAFARDVAVVFLRAYSRLRGLSEPLVVEPLAGSGVRAVRYALEADARVVANDIDPDAAHLARINAERNSVGDRVTVYQLDANELLASLPRRGIRPHVIDIDPFGSPAPFLDDAIRALGAGGVIAATATDTAPLSGTHPRALRRRYDVRPGRTAWEKEQALRILAGYMIRRAAANEYGARVLLAYYADYYVRIYIELRRGARRADKSLETLAYGVYCPGCGYTGYQEQVAQRCPYCSHPLVTVGPLYTGPLCDTQLLDAMVEEARRSSEWLAEPARVEKLFTLLREECDIVKPYYRLDKLCSILGINMPSPAVVAGELRRLGYRAARTHFDPRAVKTDAPHLAVLEAVRRLSPSQRRASP